MLYHVIGPVTALGIHTQTYASGPDTRMPQVDAMIRDISFVWVGSMSLVKITDQIFKKNQISLLEP